MAFHGSSLLSSYWNGAATYYRGLLRALHGRGWEITFFEPDAYDRQAHRDIEPPDWARVVVWQPTDEGLRHVLEASRDADVVVKASGVGVHDDALLAGTIAHAAPEALVVFWDVDAAATLGEMTGRPDHPVRRALRHLDAVMTYGGGPPVLTAYAEMGARACHPIYNAVDPATHFPVPPDRRFTTTLGLLANRLPDREARIDDFFLRAAALRPGDAFLLGGNGWHDRSLPPNVRAIGHVGTADHNAFNASARAVLNVARDSMAAMGWSPATRVFEAAGAGACLITDAWEGIEEFLAPGTEVLVARDGADVAELLATLTPGQAHAIGASAFARVRRDHTYDRRARQVDTVLRELLATRAGGVRQCA
ncbi:MAG: glycosyltransferase [Gemmatimonadaceae bacterium]|jgi:spore maturation protein CgeB|nr:glycosyltransferase [Gemmatimonadaceae bacterium]